MQINAEALNSLAQAYKLNDPKPSTNLISESKNGQATDDGKTREAFNDFVGETFFGQMLKSMRKTVGKSAYFNGGRAEEVFTEQLDQVLAQKMSETSADKFSGPMYDLFTVQRK